MGEARDGEGEKEIEGRERERRGRERRGRETRKVIEIERGKREDCKAANVDAIVRQF